MADGRIALNTGRVLTLILIDFFAYLWYNYSVENLAPAREQTSLGLITVEITPEPIVRALYYIAAS